jgi:hypothetical protein
MSQPYRLSQQHLLLAVKESNPSSPGLVWIPQYRDRSCSLLDNLDNIVLDSIVTHCLAFSSDPMWKELHFLLLGACSCAPVSSALESSISSASTITTAFSTTTTSIVVSSHCLVSSRSASPSIVYLARLSSDSLS